MNRAEGMPITAWQAESPARIVHLEDEPALAYQQILAAGLRLGQEIRVIEKNSHRYVLSDGENEYKLAPAVASNIYVMALPESEMLKREAIPLAELAAREPELRAHRNHQLAVVCRTDRRSAQAIAQMGAPGYTQLLLVRGGMEAWHRDGFPIEH